MSDLRELLEESRSVLADCPPGEADLILNGDWSTGTLRLTQEQHDALTPLQERRNALTAKLQENADG